MRSRRRNHAGSLEVRDEDIACNHHEHGCCDTWIREKSMYAWEPFPRDPEGADCRKYGERY